MVVNEEDVVNIMGGMEHAGGIKLNDHKRKLKNRFEICRKLGQGTYGKVQLGINKETGQQVAIKTIKKSKIETEADLIRIRREIQIMSSVQHPNIIHIYEVFENKEKMVLVMEIAAGGELYDYLSERKSLEEGEARRIFRQIATAVYYCHKHNICHRDLKLENILLDEDGGAKIADFGLSNVFDRKNLLSTFCGSPLYASPEIVRGCPYQGPEVDCWSLGVLLYTLVYGAMPFDGSNFKRLVKQITTGDYYEPKQPSTASSLIRGMLTVKAEERANILDICSHWWVNDGYTRNCLEEAEYLASLTPVRLDLLLSLTRQEKREPPDEVKSEVSTPTNKQTPTIDIEEIPVDADIPAGIEECDVSLSEEPGEEKSPSVHRRTDHKRKLEERSSLTEAELTSKKHDNRDAEEVIVPPPPPPRSAVPEPMECMEDQVYERPRERKSREEVIDMEKTPKIRRKNKSSGELVVAKTAESPKVKKNHDSKSRATPKTVRKSADPASKKSPRVARSEPFERPEPQASPRPPRETPTPLDAPEDIKATPVADCKASEADTIPPPLPEKKRKQVATDKNTNNREPTVNKEVKLEVNNNLNENHEIPQEIIEVKKSLGDMIIPDQVKSELSSEKSLPNCDLAYEPSLKNSTVISDKTSHKDSLVQHEKASDISLIKETLSPETPNLNESRLKHCQPDESASEKSNRLAEAEQSQPPLSGLSDLGSQPAPDSASQLRSDNDLTIRNTNLDKNNTQHDKDETVAELLVKPHPTKNENFTSSLPWVQQDKTKANNEVLVQDKVQNTSNVLPDSNLNKDNEMHSEAKHLREEAENNVELKKSLPTLESTNDSVSLSSPSIEHKSKPLTQAIKPDLQEKAQASPAVQRKEKAAAKPSINNLPKLVIKPSSAEGKENLDTVKPSINNLPKLKTPSLGGESSAPPKIHTENIPSPKAEPPLVKPFPGRPKEGNQPAQLVKQDSPKSLINNIPKPFKAENDKVVEIQNGPTIQAPQHAEENKISTPVAPDRKPIKATKSTDSVGSCISLSDDDEHKPSPKSPQILPKPNGPNINYSTLSPSNSGSSMDNLKKGPEKRDSKVIKAAAYWNNYIGEVTSKSKPPSNPKLLDKPKKIISAGIGERGLKELTSAFEQGKPVQQEDKMSLIRRNSKKMSVESCNPGLRVNDAKSVFERKFQSTAETPRLTRRASTTLEKPKVQNADSARSLQDTDLMEGSVSPSKSDSPATRSESSLPISSSVPEKDICKIPQNVISPKDIPQESNSDSKLKVPTLEPNYATERNEETKEDVSKFDQGLKPTTQQASQPKPPTSPKPKVKKEDLKNKQKSIVKTLENDKDIEAPLEEVTNLVPPLITKGIEYPEEAKVIKLKKKEESLKALDDIKTVEKKEPSVEEVQKEPTKTTKTGDITKLIFKSKSNADEVKKPNGIETSEEVKILKESEIPKLIIKSVKIKSPEPDKTEQILSPEPNLNEIRSSLKKVPHTASTKNKISPDKDDSQTECVEPHSEGSFQSKDKISENKTQRTHDIILGEKAAPNEIPTENLQEVISTEPEQSMTKTPNKERIIPITLLNENVVPKPFKLEVDVRKDVNEDQLRGKSEHYIPIRVEGSARQYNKSESHEEDAERNERLDNFNASTLSRRRWGSRKKRMSSAFSDSSMSDDDALTTPFSGLQKYTSYGKHGLGEQPLFRLKKTRPPFSIDKTESFSSGEDDFDDDGFQEMTAENLFSTLLSRVKNLTRRIHDEHDEQINWQRTRHGPPKLNPGGTHARLERTAQRNSIKRSGGDNAFSRQSSSYDDTSSQRSYNDSPTGRSYASSYTPTRIYNRSNSNNESESRYSTGTNFSTGSSKRYDESDAASDFSGSISVTSSQRLRPGYLPPPANHNTVNASNINNPSANSNDIDAQTFAQNLTTKASEVYERNIPISIHKSYNHDSPVHSKPGTPVPNSGVYMKHMKPFSLNSSDNNDRLESPDHSGETLERQRRVSRFLRPDFYDIPKEDSIYAKMRELEDEDKKKPRFLRAVQSRGRESTSGRSTPLDLTSYSEDRSRSDTKTPFGDASTPTSEGGRTTYLRPMTHENTRHSRKKYSVEQTDQEQDALLAGISKLRRQGLEHSTEVSEISDGFRTPEDTESITSEIFGVPDFVAEGEESFRERFTRSPYLSRSDNPRSSEKKVARRSVSRELVEEPTRRYTSARPVARRSVSRELFDMKYNTGKTSPYTISDYTTQLTSPVSRRFSRFSRDSSNLNNLDVSEDTGVSSGYNSTYIGSERSRSISQNRGMGSRPDNLPSRPLLSSAGRSSTQNEILRSSPLNVGRLSEDEGSLGRSYGGSLKDRNRQDWRRISVPERGKDFNSLPRKYNRENKKTFF